MTKEEITNVRKARMIFWPEYNGYAKPGYVLHHKDTTLKYRDPVRYHEWRPEDLVPMTRQDHMKLHHTDAMKNVDHKKQAESLRNFYKTHESPMKGKHHPEEAKQKIREAHLGKPLSEEHKAKISASGKGTTRPPRNSQWAEKQREARLGLQFWNNGIINKMVRICPGEGWVKGRLKI